MSFHALYVCRLANELNQLLQGAILTRVYSVDKNHLYIQFTCKNETKHLLSFRVEGNKLYIHFPDAGTSGPGNAQDQFKALWNLPLLSVVAHPGERSFHMDLGQASLLFLCYGRQANVLCMLQDDVQLFRKKTSGKLSFSPGNLKELAQAKWPENRESFLNSSFITPLLKKNFLSVSSGETAFKKLFQEYMEGIVYLNRETDHYYLDALKNDRSLSDYPNLSNALNPYTELQLGLHFFTGNKENLLRDLRNEIAGSEKKLKALNHELSRLGTQKNYRHLGDLLLSNLPLVQPGMACVDLIDYLDGQEIRIPLNEKLSPQDNAQRFYRKAKNQHIQETRIREEIGQVENRYLRALEKLEAIEACATMQELRIHLKEKKKQPDTLLRLPYHSFSFQGYAIMVGKQARDNDELSLKIAKKDDLWLHARDVSGSHVVIRKKGLSPFPEPVIMAAAGLALWFSKRRNEALAPVIYTEKKFVRKRKGDPAGAVVVDKEKVLMAAPISPDQF